MNDTPERAFLRKASHRVNSREMWVTDTEGVCIQARVYFNYSPGTLPSFNGPGDMPELELVSIFEITGQPVDVDDKEADKIVAKLWEEAA